jgi:hypothetical protein
MMVNLYTTSGCHLCEQALVMLQDLAMEITVNEVEIADNEHLMEKYGLIIPVISIPKTDQEIRWPFSTEELKGFIISAIR